MDPVLKKNYSSPVCLVFSFMCCFLLAASIYFKMLSYVYEQELKQYCNLPVLIRSNYMHALCLDERIRCRSYAEIDKLTRWILGRFTVT
jgi:hypothetical protein